MRRGETLKQHLEKREAEKQEVLSHGRQYVAQCAWEIKDNLRPTDEVVWGFKVFRDSTAIHTAYILATLEWGQMYHHYGGRDAIPILPEWLTTFINITRFLTTNADLPRQRVHVGHQDIWLNSVATWQWIGDLLQFWTDLSGPRLYGGVFHYPSALAEQLMADINPGLGLAHCVSWERIVHNTTGWLNARAMLYWVQQAEFEKQQKRHAALNDLEKATEQLYDRSLQAEAQEAERRAKLEAESAQLPPELQLAQKKRQEQAKVTGVVSSLTEDTQYQNWQCQPHRKTPVPDAPQPYSMPKEASAAACNATLDQKLGLDNVCDLLAAGNVSPTPGPKIPPAYGEDNMTIPPIHLPTTGGSRDSGIAGLASGMTSPVTKRDNRLLDGLTPGLPMEVGFSRAPGSGRGSGHKTPMSLGSPILPGTGHGGVLKQLVDSAPFTDAMKWMQREAKKKQLEEEESPYLAKQEEDPDWM